MTTTTGGGRFTLSGLLDEPYELTLLTPRPNAKVRAFVQGVRPGQAEIVLVAPPEPEPSTYVIGRVLDPDGVPIRPRKISAVQRDRRGSVQEVSWSEGQRFKLGPLLATRYHLYLWFEELPGLTYKLDLGANAEHDLGDLQLERPGSIELDLRGSGGELLSDFALVFLRREGELHVNALQTTDGFNFEGEELYPGVYRLELQGSNLALDQPTLIEVRAGETTRRKLTLVAGQQVLFMLNVPEGQSLPREFRLFVRDSSGAILVDEAREPQSQKGLTWLSFLTSLPAGQFTYSGTSAEGWTVEGTYEVSEEMQGMQSVTVDLLRKP